MISIRSIPLIALIAVLSGLPPVGVASTRPSPLPADAALAAQALAETGIPVRAGLPGASPFWNGEAVQFLYAPAFAFPSVTGATAYRFSLKPQSGAELAFTATHPWVPLSAVWPKVPVGPVLLTVQALDGDDRPLGRPSQRTFHRAAPFGGAYAAPSMAWEESARTALAALVHSPDLRCWFATGQPEEEFHLYRYPYKIVGAAAAALASYAIQSPAPSDAGAAMTAARRAADYLIGLSFPADAAWAFHPPTYHPTLFRDRMKGHMIPANHMTSSGAESGLYYLNLFAATKDEKYLQAAVRIAETYARRQLPEGSWQLFVRAQDGTPVADNVLIPTMVVDFLDQLVLLPGGAKFGAMRDRALAWVEANPVRTWNWQGQFEDVQPQAPYLNLTKHDAGDYALHLLRAGRPDAKTLDLALEIIRFAEDQFVMWDQPPAVAPGKQTAGGAAAGRTSRWMLPCVVEQYRAYSPVCASSAKLIRLFIAAYRATGDRLFLAKAQALAGTLIRTQSNAKAPGRYLTWVMQPSGPMWFNCELLAVQAIRELAAIKPNSP